MNDGAFPARWLGAFLREKHRTNFLKKCLAGAGGVVGANRRMRRAIERGQLRRQPLKRGMLVAPNDTWPRFDGGISMELAGTTDEGLQMFSYTHSAAYQVCCAAGFLAVSLSAPSSSVLGILLLEFPALAGRRGHLQMPPWQHLIM